MPKEPLLIEIAPEDFFNVIIEPLRNWLVFVLHQAAGAVTGYCDSERAVMGHIKDKGYHGGGYAAYIEETGQLFVQNPKHKKYGKWARWCRQQRMAHTTQSRTLPGVYPEIILPGPANKYAIGAMLVGNFRPDGAQPTAAQMKTAVALASACKEVFPDMAFTGHFQWSEMREYCPGLSPELWQAFVQGIDGGDNFAVIYEKITAQLQGADYSRAQVAALFDAILNEMDGKYKPNWK